MAITTFDRTNVEDARIVAKYYNLEDYETKSLEELLTAIDGYLAIEAIFHANEMDASGNDASGNPYKICKLDIVRDASNNYMLQFS